MIELDRIGGGIVRRRFTLAGEALLAGCELTREQLSRIPIANRRALIENRFIDVWPVHAGTSSGERHIVHHGKGAFDVIEGRKLNDEPLSKEEAESLAGRRN